MEKTIEIPEGYEARIEGNKVILEPKESEDEKIMKELLEVIRHCYEDGGYELCTDDYKKYSAYLERQKGIVMHTPRYAPPEQKEQKSIQDREEREYVRTIKSLIADFLRDKDEVDREYYQDIYDWLDGRHIEQKPAEWSEEDKVMLNNIIWSVHMKSIIKPLYEMDDRSRYKKYEDFLKTLPERFNLQPNWKPSEEQMDALKVSSEYEPCIKNREYLKSLYADLKKL